MSFTDSNGGALSKAQIVSAATTIAGETVYQIGADVHQRVTQDGDDFEQNVRLALVAGQKITQTQLDAMFKPATIDTVTPVSGLAAGGTNITIKGTNFGGVTAVTVGGVAVTNLKVVSETTITCTTGAHAAGAVSVVVTDDSGAVTKTTAYTYV
jgi:IPT/TIG domain